MKNRVEPRIGVVCRTRPIGKILSAVALCATLVACGGSSGDDPPPTTDIPIIVGTGVTDRQLARDELDVKASSGEKSTVTVDANTSFSAEVEGTSPFLSRLDLGNDEYLYGIGFANDQARVEQNVHSYSDLVIRNWFATQGRNIDADFDSAAAIALPTEAEIDAILASLTSLLALVMDDYSVTGVDLLSGTTNTTINTFILQNPVIINNTTFNIIVNNDPVDGDGVQTVVTDGLDLDTDLTVADTERPSTPTDVRAIGAGATEIVIVWSPSTDNVGVAAYQVFRDGVDIAQTPYPVFTDTVSDANAHVYTVIAVDAAGNESLESAGATGMTVGTPDTIAPPTPLAVTLMPSSSTMRVSWQQTNIDDVAGFQVFGAEVNEAVALLATVSSTFMTDTAVKSGTEYCYQVVAVDASGNASDPTELTCGTIGGSVVGPPVEPPLRDVQIAFSAADYGVTENQASVVVRVQRLGETTEAVSVDYTVTGQTAVDGEDFTATSGTLQWAAGDTADKTITVQIAADSDGTEGDETFVVTLSNLSSNANFGTISTTTVTISDVAATACTTELETTTITENTTLNLDCYLVNSSIDVRSPANLTIEEGVTLKFGAGTELLVRQGGSLTAVGTATNPIVITAQDMTEGFWEGVYFNASVSSSNRIEHAVIEYGGAGNLEANLSVWASRVTVADTTLRHSDNYGFNINGTSTVNSFTGVTSTQNAIAGKVGPEQASGIDDSGAFTGNSTDVVEVSTEAIGEDSSWSDIGVPWLTDGIDVRAELILEAGVEIQFGSGGQLLVRNSGQLTTEGTSAEPVLLTGMQQSVGYWNGLYFNDSDGATNTLKDTIIEYGGSGSNEANLTTFGDTQLSAENVILRNGSGAGFRFANSVELQLFDQVTSTGNALAGTMAANDLGQVGDNNTFTGNTDDSIYLLSSLISDAQTWPTLDVSVTFDDLDVREALTLTPGSMLIATNGAEIVVRDGGSFRAEGTASQNILITAEQAIAGYWEGIYFNSANSVNNVFDFVAVEYGGFGATAGNIRSFCSASALPTVTISNSMFDNSAGYGIYAGNNCNIILGENVTFMGNAEGDTNIVMP